MHNRLKLAMIALILTAMVAPMVDAQRRVIRPQEIYVVDEETIPERLLRYAQRDPEMMNRRTCISSITMEVNPVQGMLPISFDFVNYDPVPNDRTSIMAYHGNFTRVGEYKIDFSTAQPMLEERYGVHAKEYDFSSRTTRRDVVAGAHSEVFNPYTVSPDQGSFSSRTKVKQVIAHIGGLTDDFVDFDPISNDPTSIQAYYRKGTSVALVPSDVANVHLKPMTYARVGGTQYTASRQVRRENVAHMQKWNTDNVASYSLPICKIIHQWDPRDMWFREIPEDERLEMDSPFSQADLIEGAGDLLRR